jgi:hypothetical protein
MQVDEWELDEWSEEKNEESNFPIKRENIDNVVNQLKEQEKVEIDRSNQETVHDLFQSNKLPLIKESYLKENEKNKVLISKQDYENYSKDCAIKLKANKASSLNILSFYKTLIDENKHKISVEHLNALLQHIHQLIDDKKFKPIVEKDVKIGNDKKKQKNYDEIFGSAENEYDDSYSNLEDKYS